MRLPQQLLESPWFIFDSDQEFLAALEGEVASGELAEVARLSALGLPPIVSREALSVMIGVNPGFIWSLERRSKKQYRSFVIKKGKKEREIFAPKIGLKIIQKWIGWQLQKHYAAPDHVFGFIPGRSHIAAAQAHCGSAWVLSNDVRDFFPTTTQDSVVSSLIRLGYSNQGAELIGSICCLNGVLAQGSPASPILSNLAFADLDLRLAEVAARKGLILTRFADDIVFSSGSQFPEDLEGEIEKIFENQPWRLSPEKRRLNKLPARLKVHGLLVDQDVARLTKGYRNRLRAFAHLYHSGKVRVEDSKRISGHLQYARQIASHAENIRAAQQKQT